MLKKQKKTNSIQRGYTGLKPKLNKLAEEVNNPEITINGPKEKTTGSD